MIKINNLLRIKIIQLRQTIYLQLKSCSDEKIKDHLFDRLLSFGSFRDINSAKKEKSFTFNDSNHSFRIIKKEFIVREQKEPDRFRLIKNIGVSGSSQFSKNSLTEIVKKIREHNNAAIAIIDVREELHLLGDNDLGHVIAEKDWSEINHKLRFIIKDEERLAQTGLLEREDNIAKNLNLKYLRIPVADASVPHEKDIDSFLEFFKDQTKADPKTWFHVHCEHGHGRTTTFMTLVHILNTKGDTKLGDILDEQYECGKVNLAYPPKDKEKIKDHELQRQRFAFLEEFHQYVNDKESGFFAGKSWSDWKKIVSE